MPFKGVDMNPGSNEWLDLVDENDCVIGKMQRQEVHERGLTNFRAVQLFIENDQGLLWIPRRAAHKVTYPLGLDFSVSGCVDSGETYEQALIREAQEEVNLVLQEGQYEYLGYLTPHQHGTAAFQKVYKLKSNVSPDYNEQDFCEASWMKPQELIALLLKGEKAKFDLIKVLQYLYKK